MSDGLKVYSAPWEGRVLLACRKCQKKLKGDKRLGGLAKLRKTVKQLGKGQTGSAVHVLNVPCMDLCPKGGVTVCDPARNAAGLVIVRSESDLMALVAEE